ncbi:MAG: 5-dehydro-4-deoxy-D-glucuronate isomerase [Clostridiales bacterium]
MDIRESTGSKDFKNYDTIRIRDEYLIKNLFVEDALKMVYSHVDRVITGGVLPKSKDITLEANDEIRADYFLQRREMGVINIGSKGSVIVDGKEYKLDKKDGLYIGMGNKEIIFRSESKSDLAKFYFVSTPAHKEYPIEKIDIKNVECVHLGSNKESNDRKIYKYIHPDGVKSCQLVMGLTILAESNMWNTMPCHTHERRMEVYLYFDMKDDSLVFHLMGKPEETRHIVVRNEEAVISPSWSIHSGVGTSNYTFIWGMAGENQIFTDMDSVDVSNLK